MHDYLKSRRLFLDDRFAGDGKTLATDSSYRSCPEFVYD